MVDIDKLKQLRDKATTGLWEVDSLNNIRVAPNGRPIVATIHDDEDYLPRMVDAAYIVAACNSIPDLVHKIHELEGEIVDLQTQLDMANDEIDTLLEWL